MLINKYCRRKEANRKICNYKDQHNFIYRNNDDPSTKHTFNMWNNDDIYQVCKRPFFNLNHWFFDTYYSNY